MKKWFWLFALVAIALVSSQARAAIDLAAFDAAANAEIDARDPEAGKLFRQANDLRNVNPQQASRVYGEVLAKVPDFDHALRRKCGIDAHYFELNAALALCRKAVGLRRSPENLAGLATAIVAQGAERAGLFSAEALQSIDEAARLAPNDEYVHQARCMIGLTLGDEAKLRDSLKRLDVLAPNDPQTQVWGALVAMADARWKDADARIARAEALGAPADMIVKLKMERERVEASTPPLVRAASVLAKVTLGWALGLVALALAGFVVSKLTLRALATNADAAPVRSLYRAIVWLGAAYYFLSLPLVAVFVIGAAAGVVLLILATGWIPVKLLIIIGFLAIATLGATLKSVFQRIPDVPPGTPVGDDEHLRLHAVLAQVAQKVGTRELDEVRLTVGTELAVTERGRSFTGEGQRTLILGIALLDGLRVRELKSLLAHEFGHFRNEDTAGGSLALRVRRSILLMAVHLAHSGAAAWWNPAWLFVVNYQKLFLRMTQGASRLQEVLADRSAVAAYGSSSFRRGLRHVIKRSVTFDAHVEHSVSDATDLRRGWANLYQYEPSKQLDDEALDEKYRERLDEAPSPYDSHPSPRARLDAAKAMDTEGEPATETDDEEAWSLFDDREALEEKMTARVHEMLREQGVDLAAA